MGQTINFDGGLTVSVPVSNLDTAIDWYKSILGFELIYKMDELGWCEMVSPVDKVNFGLSAVEKPNPGGATPTFGVQDIAAAKKALQDNGVPIDGDIVTIENMVHLLTFYDPDNNALMFYQDLQSKT